MFLPTGRVAGPEAGWAPFQTRNVVEQATVDATGTATVWFDPVPDGERWQLDRIVVSVSAAGDPSTCWLYLGDVDARNLVDGTDAGDFDVNDCDVPIEAIAGDVLVAQWLDAAPGAVATCRVHVVVERHDDGGE